MRVPWTSVVLMLALATKVFAADLDVEAISRATGLKATVANDVAKVSLPRGDIEAVVDGVQLQPFQGLTSWAAFQRAGDETIVMGDLVLLEREVNPALSAALEAGLEVTALHNHFFFDRPRVFFMHIGGHGATDALAEAVGRTLAAAKRANATTGTGFSGPGIPTHSTLEPGTLEAVLGKAAETKDGMVKFVFGRETTMHGVRAGAAMGVNTWAAFAGSADAAVVDGDFAMLESELQPVLRTLRGASINIVAIHNHMTQEEPRIVFLHFWGKGRAEDLARGIKAALATQRG